MSLSCCLTACQCLITYKTDVSIIIVIANAELEKSGNPVQPGSGHPISVCCFICRIFAGIFVWFSISSILLFFILIVSVFVFWLNHFPSCYISPDVLSCFLVRVLYICNATAVSNAT